MIPFFEMDRSDKEITGCPVLRGEMGCGGQQAQSSFQGDI